MGSDQRVLVLALIEAECRAVLRGRIAEITGVRRIEWLVFTGLLELPFSVGWLKELRGSGASSSWSSDRLPQGAAKSTSKPFELLISLAGACSPVIRPLSQRV